MGGTSYMSPPWEEEDGLPRSNTKWASLNLLIEVARSERERV